MEVALPRKPRLFIPEQPQHIVVRGHNREPVLVRDDDFRFLYKCLREAACLNSLVIHAWVFMHNHLHLLVTPENPDSLPKTMQSLGRRYVQYFNRCYHRSGALWEGRYKASLVDTDAYLLSCYRYIELNPVRAGMVKKPEDYAYSSYHANALGKVDSMVKPHPLFLEFIGGDVEKVSESKKADSDTGGVVRCRSQSFSDSDACTGKDRRAYRELCQHMLDRKTLTEIRRGTEKGSGIGTAVFLQKVAAMR